MIGAFVVYAVFAEFRVSRAKGKATVEQEDCKDVKIEAETKILNDDQLDALLTKKLRGKSDP
jgi:hypothetical protein